MAWIELKASDGHLLQAWCVPPSGTPRGAIVVLQEIFGVNPHIRKLCERYASQGWLAVAPALYDRVKPRVELAYGPEGVAEGRRLKEGTSDEKALRDVQAAVDYAARAGGVAVIGFCWGGTLAWLAASRLQGVGCAVTYYGTNIHGHRNERPRVPVLMHFGEQDHHIPPEHVRDIAQTHPGQPLYRYEAGHGFNCDDRAAYHAPSAAQAAQRTSQFLELHLC
jgi:carboxymethylenebutenolidase